MVARARGEGQLVWACRGFGRLLVVSHSPWTGGASPQSKKASGGLDCAMTTNATLDQLGGDGPPLTAYQMCGDATHPPLSETQRALWRPDELPSGLRRNGELLSPGKLAVLKSVIGDLPEPLCDMYDDNFDDYYIYGGHMALEKLDNNDVRKTHVCFRVYPAFFLFHMGMSVQLAWNLPHHAPWRAEFPCEAAVFDAMKAEHDRREAERALNNLGAAAA